MGAMCVGIGCCRLASLGAMDFAGGSASSVRMLLRSLARWRGPLVVGFGIAVMVLLLLWLMGGFRARVAPGVVEPVRALVADAAVHTVALTHTPRFEDAVGTIRAVHETAVAARILGRIRTLSIERAGQVVRRDEVIAELEAQDLVAAVEVLRAAQVAAETRRDKATLDRDRTQELVQRGVAAPDRLETDAAALRAAAAAVEQSQQAVAGAVTALSFATVRAPIDGIVVDKKVSPGDVVQPGQLICTLYDPSHLQLVAVVREQLAGVLQTGQEVLVTIDALGKECRGSVAEIVPDAQAQSRSFEVKVVGPCQPGIVTGMFGRLHVPLGERDLLAVPAAAVSSIGQLDFVYVVGADRALARRYVRTGERAGDGVEILAGLAPGERIAADARGQ